MGTSNLPSRSWQALLPAFAVGSRKQKPPRLQAWRLRCVSLTKFNARRGPSLHGLIHLGLRVRVDRPDPGDDLPQIVRAFHESSERRHRPDNVLRTFTNISRLFQAVGTQGYESEQRVVVGSINPSVIGQ